MIELDRASLDRVLPSTRGADWDDVMNRFRARRDRNRRLALAFVVAAFVVVAGTATALGVRMFVLDKGFVGVPPEDATPSAPGSGRLVLSLTGRSNHDHSLTRVRVYADGRVIWAREGDLPQGANRLTTGLLEQHLTPEGVERMRSEVVSTGLFDHDLALSSRRFIWGEVAARVNDRLVHVAWSNPDPSDNDPAWAPVPATPEQERGLESLDALLRYPGWQLPASAWEDEKARAYVPSSFSVCYMGWPAEVSHPQSDPARILSLLPQPAQDILAGKHRTRRTGQFHEAGGPYYPAVSECTNVTTEEARALVRTFEDASLEPFEPALGLAYRFDVPGARNEKGMVELEPLLPDGESTSLRSG